jgi:DNA-binding winged helix-turn-helix (wHTH) protein
MRYDFGRCHLDTAKREVALDGVARHLSPKAFELLRLLVDERPRVVTKAELMRRLWPDSFVEEANLPVLVGEVRAAIGDAGTAQIIRTHHRVGYAFAAAVRESPPASNRPHADAPSPALWLLGRRIALATGTYVVGRDRNADVWIDDPSVSRRHARLVVAGDSVAVEDLESRNGTRVRGALVSEPVQLAEGDVVTFGAIDARYHAQAFDDAATNPL